MRQVLPITQELVDHYVSELNEKQKQVDSLAEINQVLVASLFESQRYIRELENFNKVERLKLHG